VKSEKDVLTTGDVARLCRVTIRTVIKWYEHGRLPGYRLPGSRDRRFTRAAVEQFLREHGMPFGLPAPEAAPADGRRRVLVVDDDAAVRSLVVRALAPLDGLSVDTAGSGWEAGLKTAALRPHLLLLDYRLGDTTGDQVVTAVRSMALSPSPAILIMSAHLPARAVEEVLALGAAAFLRKPFAVDELRALVVRHSGAPPIGVVPSAKPGSGEARPEQAGPPAQPAGGEA
jgi:excisionase family DNA binding protein